MTRLLLITLLVLSSGPAYAEWVPFDTTDEKTVYIDPDTSRRNGDLVKMWELTDYKTIQTVAHVSLLSVKIQREYDCVEERGRVLAMTEFSGNMGSGRVVWSKSEYGGFHVRK